MPVLLLAAAHQHACIVAVRGHIERRVRGEEVGRLELQLVDLDGPADVSPVAAIVLKKGKGKGQKLT